MSTAAKPTPASRNCVAMVRASVRSPVLRLWGAAVAPVAKFAR